MITIWHVVYFCHLMRLFKLPLIDFSWISIPPPLHWRSLFESAARKSSVDQPWLGGEHVGYPWNKMSDPKENGQCSKPGLGCFVIAWISVATIALILSYFIARSNGDVSFIVPSISDTTYKDPEGAIFAEFFNATAILTLVMMAVRYFQVKMINREIEGSKSSPLSQLNLLSNVFGLGSALGVSVVANFRSREVILS